MKGFDRPLRPDWIYDFVTTVNAGDKIIDHNEEFEKILWQLDGKEGKRKVRTVLTRYFLKTAENPKSKVVEDVPIIEICKNHKREEIEPLLLYYLLVRAPILRFLTNIISNVYGTENDINYYFLRGKVIEKMGERDISGRSLRNFLQTLVSFGVLEKADGDKFVWNKRLRVDNFNACHMLKIYSEELVKSPQINLSDLDTGLLLFFDMPDIEKIGKQYNTRLWEYSIRFNKHYITFYKN